MAEEAGSGAETETEGEKEGKPNLTDPNILHPPTHQPPILQKDCVEEMGHRMQKKKLAPTLL